MKAKRLLKATKVHIKNILNKKHRKAVLFLFHQRLPCAKGAGFCRRQKTEGLFFVLFPKLKICFYYGIIFSINYAERGKLNWHINANGKGRLNLTDPPGICSVKIISIPTAEEIFAGAIALIRKTGSSMLQPIPL